MGSGSNADTAAAEAMPGSRSQRCKDPARSHRKASELHGEVIKPELGLWH